eukprot:s617_g33.t1
MVRLSVWPQIRELSARSGEFPAMAHLRYVRSFIDEEAPAEGMARSQSQPALGRPAMEASEEGAFQADYTVQLEQRAFTNFPPQPARAPAPVAPVVAFEAPVAAAAAAVPPVVSDTGRGSCGSRGHPHLCRRPCIHFAKGECELGDACGYCHFTHAKCPSLDKRQRAMMRNMASFVGAGRAGWKGDLLGYARGVLNQGSLVEYECYDTRQRPQGKAVIRLIDWDDYSAGTLKATHICASDEYYEWYATRDIADGKAVYHICQSKRADCTARLGRGDRREMIHLERWRMTNPLVMLEHDYSRECAMRALERAVDHDERRVPEPGRPPGPPGGAGAPDPTGLDKELAGLGGEVEAEIEKAAKKAEKGDVVVSPKGSVGAMLEKKAAERRAALAAKEVERKKRQGDRGRSRSRRRRRRGKSSGSGEHGDRSRSSESPHDGGGEASDRPSRALSAPAEGDAAERKEAREIGTRRRCPVTSGYRDATPIQSASSAARDRDSKGSDRREAPDDGRERPREEGGDERRGETQRKREAENASISEVEQGQERRAKRRRKRKGTGGRGEEGKKPNSPETMTDAESFETVMLEEDGPSCLEVLRSWLHSEETGGLSISQSGALLALVIRRSGTPLGTYFHRAVVPGQTTVKEGGDKGVSSLYRCCPMPRLRLRRSSAQGSSDASLAHGAQRSRTKPPDWHGLVVASLNFLWTGGGKAGKVCHDEPTQAQQMALDWLWEW